eukprot:Trichotokara_eunicae@DN5217_c0_g1_i2.p1
MFEGKFFRIQLFRNNLCFDVKNGAISSGADVVLAPVNELSKTQLFYTDPWANVIRCKSSDDFVFQVKGDNLVVETFNIDEYNQRWVRVGDRLEHMENKNWVITTKSDAPYSSVTAGQLSPSDSKQKFDFKHGPAQCMFIQNEGSGDVLDCRAREMFDGGEVIVFKQHDATVFSDVKHQLWFEDKQGTIRQAYSGFSMDGSQKKVVLRAADMAVESRSWTLAGGRIANSKNPSELLESQFSLGNKISGVFRKEGEDIVNLGKTDKFKGTPQQKFRSIFFDD